MNERDTDRKNERRRFTRFPFDVQARFANASRLWRTALIDVSLNGALIERPEDWNGRPGEACTLELVLDATTVIRMEGEVAHVEKDCAGFHCRHIDVESMSHLRRLVELNLGDPQLLDRELAELG